MRKKLTAVLLAATMLLTSGVTVFADRVDAVIDKPYLALGADLSPQEQMTVLSLLGLSDINVDDYDIISITNADEHEYLDKYLDASIIGTRALSSVLVVGKEAGNGIHVTTKNISYCTEGMYRNALLTAGIEDADITVAGPFSISGTAALVGAIKAYETMTGEEIDDENLDAANDELVLTGKLVEDIGDSDKTGSGREQTDQCRGYSKCGGSSMRSAGYSAFRRKSEADRRTDEKDRGTGSGCG